MEYRIVAGVELQIVIDEGQVMNPSQRISLNLLDRLVSAYICTFQLRYTRPGIFPTTASRNDMGLNFRSSPTYL